MPGMMKSVDKKSNPGLAKLPQDVRNKMGYMKKGGTATKMAKGGTAAKKMMAGGTATKKMMGGGYGTKKGMK